MKRLIGCVLLYSFFMLPMSCGGNDASTIALEEKLSIEAETNAVLMNNERMHDLLQRVDPELQGQLGSWVVAHDTIKAQVITGKC